RNPRARGCTGPLWPPCCPRPCTGIPAGSLRALHDLDHAPALGLADRARLHHADGVAHMCVVRLVVRRELVAPAHRLGVQAVPHLAVDPHEDGLVHPVGHDDAGAHLAACAVGGCLGVAHDDSPSSSCVSASSSASRWRSPRGVPSTVPASCAARDRSSVSASTLASSASSSTSRWRSRRTVRVRATSWRRSFKREELSSWPVASWNRRLNSSSFALSIRTYSSSSGSSRSSAALLAMLSHPPA